MLRKKLSQRNSLCGHAGHCSYPRQIFIHPKCERKRNVLFTRPTTGSVLALIPICRVRQIRFRSLPSVSMRREAACNECHIKARACLLTDRGSGRWMDGQGRRGKSNFPPSDPILFLSRSHVCLSGERRRRETAPSNQGNPFKLDWPR